MRCLINIPIFQNNLYFYDYLLKNIYRYEKAAIMICKKENIL